jgi:hypothetical protein
MRDERRIDVCWGCKDFIFILIAGSIINIENSKIKTKLQQKLLKKACRTWVDRENQVTYRGHATCNRHFVEVIYIHKLLKQLATI